MLHEEVFSPTLFSICLNKLGTELYNEDVFVEINSMFVF